VEAAGAAERAAVEVVAVAAEQAAFAEAAGAAERDYLLDSSAPVVRLRAIAFWSTSLLLGLYFLSMRERGFLTAPGASLPLLRNAVPPPAAALTQLTFA